MSLLETLQGFMGRFTSSGGTSSRASSRGGVIGVDIGSSSIKIVELKKERGAIALSTYGELALGPRIGKSAGATVPLDPDQIASALIELMREAHIESRSAVITIQSSASLLFTMQLPVSAESSLADIIPNEARKYIPVPMSDVTLNWSVIPVHVTDSFTPHDGQEIARESITILVAAIRNDALGGYKNMSAQAEIKPLHYEMEIFSGLRATLHNELSPIAVIDCGASQTRVAIVQYGTVMKYHSINKGGSFLTESIVRSLSIAFDRAEEIKRSEGLLVQKVQHPEAQKILQSQIDTLLAEIKMSIFEFEKEYHTALDSVYLIGGGAMLPGFSEYVATALGISVKIGHPFDKVQNPDFLDPVLDHVGPSFAIACGAALYALE